MSSRNSSAKGNNQIETCPDGHHCLNGSKCAQNPYDEGSYYCDCQEDIFEVRYEGLYCEHMAEVYCISHGSSMHSFCTNGGTCIEFVGPNGESQMGCKCPEEYEGSYCQFVRGTQPQGWPFSSSSSSQTPTSLEKKTTNIGSIVGSLIVALTLTILMVAFAYKRYFSRDNYDVMGTRQLEDQDDPRIEEESTERHEKQIV